MNLAHVDPKTGIRYGYLPTKLISTVWKKIATGDIDSGWEAELNGQKVWSGDNLTAVVYESPFTSLSKPVEGRGCDLTKYTSFGVKCYCLSPEWFGDNPTPYPFSGESPEPVVLDPEPVEAGDIPESFNAALEDLEAGRVSEEPPTEEPPNEPPPPPTHPEYIVATHPEYKPIREETYSLESAQRRAKYLTSLGYTVTFE